MKTLALSWTFLLLLVAPSTRATAQQCRAWEPGTEVGQIADGRIDEASGLAAGWINEGLLWTHNDSGDSARVFAIDRTGQTKTVVDLAGVTAVDWEDIAVGPCAPNDSTPCVWVADIGDNDSVRPSVALYRFREPDLGAQPPPALTIDDATQIVVTYEGGPRNAETLMIHPTDGRVFIVDKTVGDPSNMWLVPTDGVTPASIVATQSLGEIGGVSNQITGGDFAPDGAEFSIRTYTHVYTFCGADPPAAFESSFTSVIATHLAQGEALTYSRDGQRMYATSEVWSTETPPLLEMAPVGSTLDDGAPDGGAVASTDMGRGRDATARGGDVQIRILDTEPTRGCSCRIAQSKRAEPLAGLGYLLIGLLAVRLRTRPRR